MHPQAELIQHLNAVRSYLVTRHADVVAGHHLSEGCICSSSATVTGYDESTSVHVAVKRMVQAEFAAQGKVYNGNVYLYPVRISNCTDSPSNYYGTEHAVTAGHAARLALIDKWIAAAHKKLLAAVFRKAIDELKDQPFMCNAIKVSAQLLEGGDGDWWEYKSGLLTRALDVLALFKPTNFDMKSGWYTTYHPRTQALRIAILNLCITEVTRGFK